MPYRVPVEVKKEMMTSDMGQYMGSFEAEGTKPNMGMGYLIDEDSLRLAFSPLICDGLTLFLQSINQVAGRHHLLPWSMFHFACFNRYRVEFTSKELEECIRKNWLAVKETAESISKESPPFEYQGVLHDYLEEIDTK